MPDDLDLLGAIIVLIFAFDDIERGTTRHSENRFGDSMSEEPNDERQEADAIRLACAIVNAYVRKNPLPAADVPAALRTFYRALATLPLRPTSVALPPTMKPAVPIKKSVRAEYIICLEDGRKLKMLKRYLLARYGLTPKQYREKWHLPSSYPMTAPKYAATRSAMAKKFGLGRK